MVTMAEFKGRKVFQCESCGLQYVDERIATECQKFCEKNGACSLEITKNAVNI